MNETKSRKTFVEQLLFAPFVNFFCKQNVYTSSESFAFRVWKWMGARIILPHLTCFPRRSIWVATPNVDYWNFAQNETLPKSAARPPGRKDCGRPLMPEQCITVFTTDLKLTFR